MAKVGISVKDATGTTKAMLYEDGNATGLQQAIEVVSISGSVVPGTGATNLGKAEDNAHTSGDVGVMSLGVRTDTAATISSATGDYEPFKVNNVGAVWVTPTPSTTSGLSLTRLLSAATTNATLVKSTAGNLYTVWASNTTASFVYLKIYNLSVAPTVGTSTPALTIPVPPNATIDMNTSQIGTTFSTGISIAVTGAYADADTTAVTAGACILAIFYK